MPEFKDAERAFGLLLYDAGHKDESAFCAAMREHRETMNELNNSARFVSNYSDRGAASLWVDVVGVTRRRSTQS